MKAVLVALLKAYRFAISPLYGQVCRYYPSCSAYALEAISKHGAARGSWLATRRLARCHPWCDGGVDLVPSTDNYRWWGRCPDTDGGPLELSSDTLPTASDQSPPTPHVLRGA